MKNELELWFDSLPTDEKLLLVRQLLNGIEHDLVKNQPAARPQQSLLIDDLPPIDGNFDFDAALQDFSPGVLDLAREQDIDALRLKDAADQFHTLLKKYGYVASPPSLRQLALAADKEDRERMYRERRRPTWHDWVSKEDEERAKAEETLLDLGDEGD